MREDKHPAHHRPPHLREAGEDRDGFENVRAVNAAAEVHGSLPPVI